MNRFAYLALVVVLVVVAWTAGWFVFADQIRRNVEALAFSDGETSPQVSCETLSITGFPFRFDLDCTGLAVVSGDLLVNVPELRVSAMVYRPTHLLASALGPARFSDAFTGARSRLDWQAMQASLRIADWQRIERFSLEGEGLAWTDTLFGETLLASSPNAQLHLIDIPERRDREAGIAALAGYAHITELDAPTLNIARGEVTAEMELMGLPEVMMSLLEPDALRRWQQAGGEARLVSLRAEAGESFLSAEGTASLTPAGLVNGQFVLRSRGIVEQIRPSLPEGLAPMLLGNPAEDGSYGQTLTIRGGVVLSGLVPAGMIPPLF